MDITRRKRTTIITLHEHSLMTMSQREIAKNVKISLGTVNKIIKQKHLTESVEV